MTTSLLDQRDSVDFIDRETASTATTDRPDILPAHDLRVLGLASASRSLGIRVAEFGPVQTRRAQADLVHCPFCAGH